MDDDAPTPGGAALVLEERFTRIAGDTLTYEFTMNDPAWRTSPRRAAGLENIGAGARRAEQLPAQSR